jgi:prenylated cyclic peptide (anacyclamide/piricyclamide family)
MLLRLRKKDNTNKRSFTMKTKKLTPRNAAPVQREINTTSSEGGTGLTPSIKNPYFQGDRANGGFPFAGDDAD